MDIQNILEKFLKERGVFHSEDDFKFSFAWKIKSEIKDAEIRLENPFRFNGINRKTKPFYLDILVIHNKRKIGIELKYKTKKLRFKIDGEVYDLMEHSAVDCGRYDFCKDIERLEKMIELKSIDVGYVVFLTNEHKYWRMGKRGTTIDEQFKIHESRVLQGSLRWSKKTSCGTKRGRENTIEISKKYKIHWKDAPFYNEKTKFRYLILQVI